MMLQRRLNHLNRKTAPFPFFSPLSRLKLTSQLCEVVYIRRIINNLGEVEFGYERSGVDEWNVTV